MAQVKDRVARGDNSNIYSEKDGSWRVSVRLKLPTGQAFNREQRFVTTKEKARIRRDQFFSEYNRCCVMGVVEAPVEVVAAPIVEPVHKVTLTEWIDRCAKEFWPVKIPTTAGQYAQSCRMHVVPVLGSMALEDLTQQNVRKFIYDMGEKLHPKSKYQPDIKQRLSVSSVRATKAALSSCLSIAVDEGLIPTNPATGLSIRWKGMKQARQTAGIPVNEGLRLLSQKEIKLILEKAAGTPVYPMVLLQARMGLRIAEALAVRRCDFDLSRGVLKVTQQLKRVTVGEKSVLRLDALKTDGSLREIPIPNSVKSFLKSYTGGPNDPLTYVEVVKREKGSTDKVVARSWMEPRRAQTHWTAIIDETKLNPRPTTHDLRGSFVSYLLNDCGKPVTIVQVLAGHSNVTTTLSYYSKASEANLKSVMESID